MFIVYSFLATLGVVSIIAITRRVSAGALTMKNVGWGVGILVAVVTFGFVWQNWETMTAEKKDPNPPLSGTWRIEWEIVGMPETKTDYPVNLWLTNDGQIDAMITKTRSIECVWSGESGRFLSQRRGEVAIGGTWEVTELSLEKNVFRGTYEYVAPRGKDAGTKRQGRFMVYRL